VPEGWLLCTAPGCPKAFETEQQRKRHLLTHREKSHVCDFPGCGKAFGESAKLKRHVVVHDAVRTWPCTHPGCGRVFSLASNCASHLKTHSADSMYACTHPGCDKVSPFCGSLLCARAAVLLYVLTCIRASRK
jgi:uncharacterized Zn-finger protein